MPERPTPPELPLPPARDPGWFEGADIPDWNKLRQCVHCGLCLQACPTYREDKLEADSPRGRLYLMRALHEGRIEPDAVVRDHLDSCLVCRACETACPSGVPFGHLMEATRAQLHRRLPAKGPGAWAASFLFRHVLPSRMALDLMAAGLRLYRGLGLQALVRGTGLVRLLPEGLQAAEALTPRVPPASSRRLPASFPVPPGEPHARVAVFQTCVNRVLYPEVHRAAALLLVRAGAEVMWIPAQTCCGALHAHGGRLDEARALARRNLGALRRLERSGAVDWIVSTASGCGSTLLDYEHLLRDDPEWAPHARSFSARLRDTMDILDTLGLPEPVDPPGSSVAVHDPCHLAHGMKVRESPRRLLRAAGYQVCDLQNSDFCCGSAGIYNLQRPRMAARQLRRKLLTVERAGADSVAVANPGCLMYMARGARDAGLKSRMEHPLVLLARAHGEEGF